MNADRSKTLTALGQIWERLDALCRRLWDENSAAAVEAQAIHEEFKGEVHRVESMIANVDELRAHDRSAHEEAMAGLRRQYELEIAALKKRVELLDKGVSERDARIDGLLTTIARKEEENLEFHAQVLRMSASSDETKSKKMEEFYQELVKKETQMEAAWAQRHKALESEHTHLQQILASKQTELDAWEKRRLTQEEALKRRDMDSELKAQQLALEYRKKQAEIEDLKKGLQASITELVRQYQSRLRGADAAAAPPQNPR
ncbi:MAG: hypothetical protein HY079_12010 [Elusimicrobia bacterium]|nr:hypothetical protein [Elusimicrobiota bacterium]